MQDIEKEFGPTSWSIDNKTSIYVITVLLCIAGVFAYIKLGKEKFPGHRDSAHHRGHGVSGHLAH